MEAATITPETEQPMYQQGKYPSVITTDDLVFELGKQLIGGLNKEKLLDTLLEKSKATENALVEAIKAKSDTEKKVMGLEVLNKQYIENDREMDAEIKKSKTIGDMLSEANRIKSVVEKEVVDLKLSNKKYVENNQKLDFELVRIRKKLENMTRLYHESIEKYEIDINELKIENSTEIKDISNTENKKRRKLKKKMPSKKRD